MEIVNVKEGFVFKMLKDKTLAVQEGVEGSYFCPFCYGPADVLENKCSSCNKNFPELIYYHGDDDTWIASGNEN